MYKKADVNKCFAPGMNDYCYTNTSGPHKIFLTYDTPLLDTVNTLALDKICRYASGRDSIRTIAQAGVTGVYGEGWNYSPDHPTFRDPLEVIRQHVGMCTDYANLMTCMYRSIGIDANSSIIYNGDKISGSLYWFFWHFSPSPLWPYCLYSDSLRACDGESKKWLFSFHAASKCDTFLCDASFGVFASEHDYDAWWLYYLHPRNLSPPYNHQEPPPFEHTIFDWYYFVPAPPTTVLPDSVIAYDSHFLHP